MVAYLYQQFEIAVIPSPSGKKWQLKKKKSGSREQHKYASQHVTKILMPCPNLAMLFNDHLRDISKFDYQLINPHWHLQNHGRFFSLP